MFCPPEFVHIHEILEVCKAASFVLVPYDKQQEFVYVDDRPDLLHCGKSKSVLRVAQEQELLIAFIKRFENSAFAYKLGNAPVRLTPSILRTRKRKGFYLLDANPDARPELSYVDLKTGRIDLSGTAERMTSWYQNEYLYGATAERKREHFLIQKTAERDFSEIDGWTICFERASTAWSLKDVLDIWKEKQKRRPVSKAGAPNKIDAALEVFESLYPDGRGSVPWKTVHKNLLSRGVDIGLSTLQKAVRGRGSASSE